MAIGGIILAGGRSTRMGQPKAMLPCGTESLLERTARILGHVVDPILLVIAADQTVPAIPHVTVVRDELPDAGPAAGLLSGLRWLEKSGLQAAFVTGCDTPFLQPAFVRTVIDYSNGVVTAMPLAGGHWHPLLATWHVDAIPMLVQQLASGRRSLVGLLDKVPMRAVPETSLLDPHQRLPLPIFNINTPEDYATVLELGPLPAIIQPPLGETIRTADPYDAVAISELVTAASEKYITPDYSSTGASVLLESLSPDAIAQRVREGFRYRVAVDYGRIVGVVALKENAHLYHLFVAETHHRRGIARRLWEFVRDEAISLGNPGRFTLNASRYAIPIYERLGFVKDGGIAVSNDVTCQPMLWQRLAAAPGGEDRLI